MTSLAEKVAAADTANRDEVQAQRRANRERNEEKLRELLAQHLGVTQYEVAWSPVFGVTARVERYEFVLAMDGSSQGLHVLKTCPACGDVYKSGPVYAYPKGDHDRGAECLARVLRKDYDHRCATGEAAKIARSIKLYADEFHIPVRVMLNTVEERLAGRLAA